MNLIFPPAMVGASPCLVLKILEVVINKHAACLREEEHMVLKFNAPAYRGSMA